jgi:hypothetical protein
VVKLALGNHIFCSFLSTTSSDISSVIFNRLRMDATLGISYYFFNHSIANETSEKVLQALLRRTLAQLDEIPPAVEAEYRKAKSQNIRLNRKTLERLF